MTDEWGAAQLRPSSARDGVTAAPGNRDHRDPDRRRRRTRRLVAAAMVAALAGVGATGWWVLSDTFGTESPIRPDLNRDGGTGRATLPEVGLARAVTCRAERQMIEDARQAAAIFAEAGLAGPLRESLAEPDGEFFSVAEDGTVTTVQPLPVGCGMP